MGYSDGYSDADESSKLADAKDDALRGTAAPYDVGEIASS